MRLRCLIVALIVFVVVFCTNTNGENGGGEEPPEEYHDTIMPIISITYPHDDDDFIYCNDINITTDAYDNDTITFVNFRIRNTSTSYVVVDWNDYMEPYEYLGWHPEVAYGNQWYFTLRVTAYDTAGNSSSDEVSVSVVH